MWGMGDVKVLYNIQNCTILRKFKKNGGMRGGGPIFHPKHSQCI